MTRLCLFGSLFLLVLLAACSDAEPVPGTESIVTGIPVAPEFAPFYAEMGGRPILGVPITEAFRLDGNGRLVQYYRSFRLEYVNGEVSVYPLGAWALAGVENPQPAPVPESGPVRTFPDAEFTLQGEFLSFYEAHHGETLLGSPISPQLNEGERRVQYFENGRLEWRPELPIAQRVQVSDLGQAHFDAEMAFAYHQDQVARPVSAAGLTRVDVFASVEAAVLYAGDEQTLYVTVLTPEGRPVEDVPVTVTVSYGTESFVINLGRTDVQGRLSAPITPLNATPGQQVRLEVRAYNSGGGDPIGQAMLSFKTWW